jgi:hypothetical protein
MADVRIFTARAPYTVANGNRYLLGSGDAAWASQLAIQVDLNGGTLTYNFQVRVTGGTPWQAAIATPVSTGTAATSGTASDVWNIDASGKEVAVNMTAGTGSPLLTFAPVVG